MGSALTLPLAFPFPPLAFGALTGLAWVSSLPFDSSSVVAVAPFAFAEDLRGLVTLSLAYLRLRNVSQHLMPKDAYLFWATAGRSKCTIFGQGRQDLTSRFVEEDGSTSGILQASLFGQFVVVNLVTRKDTMLAMCLDLTQIECHR